MLSPPSWLYRPQDIAFLVAFRIGYGALLLVSTVRFLLNGWVEDLFLTPTFFFHYPGLEWVVPWPGRGMYLHFWAMAGLAFLVMVGKRTRPSLLALLLLFGYAEAIDKTNYLNHYYLLCLLGGLMLVMPVEGAVSFDSRRHPSLKRRMVPAWMLWALRLQVGGVYFFAGLAKMQPDWLVHAQPLRLWLLPHQEMPFLGPLLSLPAAPWALSWGGAAFDLTIPLWLSLPRTRLPAYMAVVVFHVLTGLLFPIGMFPWVMVLAALVFFPPDWPRRLRRGAPSSRLQKEPLSASVSPRNPLLEGGLLLYFFLQLALPLRHFLAPGNVLWTEDGFRFAWQVMVMEKVGRVSFRVEDPATGRHRTVDPRSTLTKVQVKMMSTQPDLILQFAHFLREEEIQQGRGVPQIGADTWVSLNGRPGRPLIDPTVDLARVSWRDPHASFVLPLKEEILQIPRGESTRGGR